MDEVIPAGWEFSIGIDLHVLEMDRSNFCIIIAHFASFADGLEVLRRDAHAERSVRTVTSRYGLNSTVPI